MSFPKSIVAYIKNTRNQSDKTIQTLFHHNGLNVFDISQHKHKKGLLEKSYAIIYFHPVTDEGHALCEKFLKYKIILLSTDDRNNEHIKSLTLIQYKKYNSATSTHVSPAIPPQYNNYTSHDNNSYMTPVSDNRYRYKSLPNRPLQTPRHSRPPHHSRPRPQPRPQSPHHSRPRHSYDNFYERNYRQYQEPMRHLNYDNDNDYDTNRYYNNTRSSSQVRYNSPASETSSMSDVYEKMVDSLVSDK